MEENCNIMSSEESKNSGGLIAAPPRPDHQPALHRSSGRGLSLRKSLQRFLQIRKDRIQASMPY